MKNGTYTFVHNVSEREKKVNLSNGMAYYKTGEHNTAEPLSVLLEHHTLVRKERASAGLYDLVRVRGAEVVEVVERNASYSICATKRSQMGKYGAYQIRRKA